VSIAGRALGGQRGDGREKGAMGGDRESVQSLGESGADKLRDGRDSLKGRTFRERDDKWPA